MKDTYIKIRVSSGDKKKFKNDASEAGFDDLSAYVLQLLRIMKPVPRKK